MQKFCNLVLCSNMHWIIYQVFDWPVGAHKSVACA